MPGITPMIMPGMPIIKTLYILVAYDYYHKSYDNYVIIMKHIYIKMCVYIIISYMYRFSVGITYSS